MKKIIGAGTLAAALLTPLLTLASRDGERLAKGLVGSFLGFMIVMAILSIVLTIFWIMMLIHACTKDIENKVLWIVLLAFFGYIAAIVYYFMVKRPFIEKPAQPAPVPQDGSSQQPGV